MRTSSLTIVLLLAWSSILNLAAQSRKTENIPAIYLKPANHQGGRIQPEGFNGYSVWLPWGYSWDPAERYEALYVVGALTETYLNLLEHLMEEGRIPRMLIIMFPDTESPTQIKQIIPQIEDQFLCFIDGDEHRFLLGSTSEELKPIFKHILTAKNVVELYNEIVILF